MRSPFELQSLIDWLEKQEPKTRYDYANIYGCLNCQYLKAVGFSRPYVGGTNWYSDRTSHELPSSFDKIAESRPWTFGAALARAKALL